MTFPQEYPPGCPQGAEQYDGRYYRFCIANRKDVRDERNHQLPNGRFDDPDDCGNWALSGYLSNEHLEEARQALLPIHKMAKHWVVMAYDLKPQDGEIKHTPIPEVSEQHHDLWLYEGVKIAQRLVI